MSDKIDVDELIEIISRANFVTPEYDVSGRLIELKIRLKYRWHQNVTVHLSAGDGCLNWTIVPDDDPAKERVQA